MASKTLLCHPLILLNLNTRHPCKTRKVPFKYVLSWLKPTSLGCCWMELYRQPCKLHHWRIKVPGGVLLQLIFKPFSTWISRTEAGTSITWITGEGGETLVWGKGPDRADWSQVWLLIRFSAESSCCTLGQMAINGECQFCHTCDGKSGPQRCEIGAKNQL